MDFQGYTAEELKRRIDSAQDDVNGLISVVDILTAIVGKLSKLIQIKGENNNGNARGH